MRTIVTSASEVGTVSKLTQCDRILRHLQDYGCITPMEAISDYGITRLGARIWDLKAKGYLIQTNMVSARNRYGEPTHYAKYVYKGESMNDEYANL